MLKFVKTAVLVWMVLGVSPYISAQRGDLQRVRKARVYITPMEDGTEAEREFFMANINAELVASGYEAVGTREGSDFFVKLGIGREDAVSYLTFTLFDSLTETEIVAVSQNYTNIEEMYTWNLYLITQAMANAPRILKGVTEPNGGSGGNNGGGDDTPYSIDEFLDRRLFFGLRGGVALGWYSLSTLSYQDSALPQATGVVFGLSGGFRFFPFFSLQAEAVFERETLAFRTAESEGSTLAHYTDTYTGYSLLFPVTAKFSLNLNPFFVSVQGGMYYRLELGGLELTSSNPNMADKTYEYGASFPFGLTAGLEAGFNLGPGVLFIDLRYGYDLGMTAVQNDQRLGYTRNRIRASLGCQFAIRTGKA